MRERPPRGSAAGGRPKEVRRSRTRAGGPGPAAGRRQGSVRRARPGADSADAAAVDVIVRVMATGVMRTPPPPGPLSVRYAGLNTFGVCLRWQGSLREG